MRTIPLLLTLLLVPTSVFAKSDWKKLNFEDGVTVYKQKIKGSDLIAFKGVALINAPIKKVFSVLMDNTRRTEWVARLKKSVILEKFNEFDFVIYQHFKAPIFISDRDYVYRGTASRDASGRVVLKMSSCLHGKAPKTVGVRANLMRSKYVLEKVGSKTRISVEIHTDPKGWIPTAIVNMIQKSWPVKTLSGVRKQAKRSGVKDRRLPPLPKKKAVTVKASVKKKK